MAHILDAAMAKYGKAWTLQTLDSPTCIAKSGDMIEEPISLSTLMATACRSPKGVSVPEFGCVSQVGECVRNDDTESLPASIRSPNALPDGCRLGLVVRNMEDGTLQFLKMLHFKDKIAPNAVQYYCGGTPYALVFRPRPWALKKAVLSLVGRLPGFHVSRFSLDKVAVEKPIRRAQSSQWAPPEDELLTAIQYINENAPECDSQNQEYYWVLCDSKYDSSSPISGWPEAKVRIMAQNKAKGMAGAQLETDFPLHTYSLKPFLAENLMPLLYPLFMNFAFMLLDWPGVGKTPAIIIIITTIIMMILAMGCYNASRLDIPTPPGSRQAKSLDNFRHRVGNIHEGVFLDDPSREKIDLADLKLFVTTEEKQMRHGRYNDVKLAKNCCRAYAANDIQEEDEPKDDARMSITMEEFLTLLRRTFPGDSRHSRSAEKNGGLYLWQVSPLSSATQPDR